MRWRRIVAFVVAVAFLTVTMAWITRLSPASEEQDLEFAIIGSGDMSGIAEEVYLIVRTDNEWKSLWAKHTALVIPLPSLPEVDFSTDLIIGAFMGECPTSGYSVSIPEIWALSGEVHVEVVKRAPPEGMYVAQVVTHPYIFVSIEKTDMDFTFEITEDDGTSFEFPMSRTPDVTGDNFCGIDDLVGVAEHFGIKSGDPRWLPKYDINRDHSVGMDDIVETAEHFGRFY